MNFQTNRLILSDVSLNDLTDIHTLHSLPETDQFNTLGIPADIEETRKLLQDWIHARKEFPPKRYVLRMTGKNESFIGLIGITPGKVNYKNAEIWYKLMPEYWKQEYATEAVKGILNVCFNQLNLHRITAGCATDNHASYRVLEKAGFSREGMHRKILPIRGDWYDNFSYAILEEDFAG
jgi:[ribosomal protein S5]-alanine N-acetyltransferase